MLSIALVLLACDGGGEGPGPGPEPETPSVPRPELPRTAAGNVPGSECDAGDPSWVARTMPLLWGRKPHGAAEIDLWVRMAAEHGRSAVVRAMTEDPEYFAYWKEWFTDALYVARTGDKLFDDCFERPKIAEHDGSLAAYIRQNAPQSGSFGASFDMADVIFDGLRADDLSVIYRAHLFARMAQPVEGANVSSEQLEYNRRINFGEIFYRTYLGRNLGCMVCHNSEFSTTDSQDPLLDRTWQMPGHFERALLGEPTGRAPDEAYAMFRYEDVVTDRNAVRPWGMAADCGEFVAPGNVPDRDLLDQDEAFFIRQYGPEGTMYDLESDLASGVEALDGKGLTVAADGTVDGQEAFAYLLAANLASQVWATATGYELVVAHYFPRNEGQMLRLQHFADVLAESGFSLRELLVAVTTDPYYNQGLPSTCESQPYGLDPVFDPWTVTDPNPHRRENGASDMIHRLPARALLRTAHVNLGWSPRESWFGPFASQTEQELQSAVGVFLRESDPGHRGTDFQGLLAFEEEFGTCTPSAPGGSDYVDALLAEVVAAGGTVGDVAVALKDRLVAAPIAEGEQALVESLLARPFGDPADASEALEERVRLFCGVLLMSPQFQLVTDPEPPGPSPTFGVDVERDCAQVAGLMTTSGVDVSCVGTELE